MHCPYENQNSQCRCQLAPVSRPSRCSTTSSSISIKPALFYGISALFFCHFASNAVKRCPGLVSSSLDDSLRKTNSRFTWRAALRTLRSILSSPTYLTHIRR
ncbi:uncharacterized protein C8R40DRAFT_2997 [Lentinula edodes]|uniref:uncharacterized protein n=1 Tax=Lentinula edodes TaxID=5353 RepID=UPI001E8CB861|nr:uncharacterized protein C8R40DRAFT_2997 [Lentinula edodes]KAH7880901.1 hypothetical protein C8R40DRAFT_2997 [Lentinula edodes]